MICQALTQNGEPCKLPATDQHATPQGTRVMVCQRHLTVLKKQQRLGRDEEKVREWGVVPPAITNPGSTSPPMPVDDL